MAESTQYIPIKKQFSSKIHYKHVADSANKREKFFQDFVEFIILQYSEMKICCSKLNDPEYLMFNDEINEVFDIIDDCYSSELGKLCDSQISQVQDVKHNPDYKAQSLKLQFIQQQAQKFEKVQQQFLEKIREQNDKVNNVLNRNEKFNSERDQILNFYNSNYMKQSYSQISKLQEFIQQSNNDNKKLISVLEKNKTKFLESFQNFKKKSMRNRHIFEQKLYKVYKIVVEGIVKTFPQLLRKLKNVKSQLHESDPGSNQNITINRVSSQDLFSICSYLKHILTRVDAILIKCKDERLKFNSKICTLLRTEDNHACRSLTFVLDTLEKSFSRLSQISANLTRRNTSVQQEQTRTNMYESKISKSSSLQSSIRRTKSQAQKTITVTSILTDILDDMIDPLSKLTSWIQGSLIKQKDNYLVPPAPINDIAKVTYENGAQRGIADQQMWMFQDWKSDPIKLQTFPKVKQHFQKTKSQIESHIRTQGKQIVQPQKCQLLESLNKKKKGTLYVFENCVKFISLQNNSSLTIPYSAINNVKVKIDFFKLDLILYTSKGKLCFINPSSAMKTKQKIAKRIKNQDKGDDVDVTGGDEVGQGEGGSSKWKSIQLTSEQISGMQARKTKIKAQMPNISQWHQIHKYVFRNIPIDQFYFEVLSDSSKQIGGKTYVSFSQYLLLSMGGVNDYKQQKYSPKGPKFYTQEGDATFENCVNFSTRKTSYVRVLDSIPIPFMPKTAKFQQQCKLFWISNQQFAILKSSSSDMPVVSSMEISFMMSVKKQGQDVEMAFHLFFKWKKDSAFKKVMQKKVLQKSRQDFPKMMKGYQKRVKQVTAGSKQQAQQQAGQTTVDTSSSNLKSQVKTQASKSSESPTVLYLIIGIIVFIVVMKLL